MGSAASTCKDHSQHLFTLNCYFPLCHPSRGREYLTAEIWIRFSTGSHSPVQGGSVQADDKPHVQGREEKRPGEWRWRKSSTHLTAGLRNCNENHRCRLGRLATAVLRQEHWKRKCTWLTPPLGQSTLSHLPTCPLFLRKLPPMLSR